MFTRYQMHVGFHFGDFSAAALGLVKSLVMRPLPQDCPQGIRNGWKLKARSGRLVRCIKYRSVKTPWGPAAHVCILPDDEKPLLWYELWSCFDELYPGQWAIEVYPPVGSLVNNGVSGRHLWILSKGKAPGEMRIDRGGGLQQQDP
jgi:hypothetical protein